MKVEKVNKNKILKAASWYTISNFLSKGLVFLSIPIFTRLLSTNDYGIVSIYNAWVSISVIIISLGLTESIRNAKYENQFDYNNYISNVLTIIIIFTLSLTILLPLLNEFISIPTNFITSFFYIILINSFSLSVIEIMMTKLKYDYKYKISSIISLLVGLANIFLSVILIRQLNNQAYIGRILGQVVVPVILSLVFIFIIYKKGSFKINKSYWKYGLAISLPLIIHQLSNQLNNQFDRIVIANFINESAVGIYSFAYNVGMIILVFSISFDQAWLPWFLEKMKQKEYEIIKKRAKYYMIAFSLFYVYSLMFSPEIIKVMAAEEYWAATNLIPIIFMAYYFRVMYGFEFSIEFFLKKTGLISLATVLSAIINIILNIIFVPIYGYIAAAWTTLFSFVVLFALHYIATTKILKIKIYGLKFHMKYLFISVVATLVYLLAIKIFLLRLLFSLVITLIYYKQINKISKLWRTKNV